MLAFLSNRSSHAHPEEAQEGFKIGLRLAFTWNISRLEESPARHDREELPW